MDKGSLGEWTDAALDAEGTEFGMQIGVRALAEKLLRDLGDGAEAECDARASYYAMQGDTAVAEGWRRVKERYSSSSCRTSTL